MFAWPWPWLTPEQAAEYLTENGINPDFVAPPETTHCELCLVQVGEDAHVVLDPPPGLPNVRKYHISCLITHIETHMESDMDDIVNYINRKPVGIGI